MKRRILVGIAAAIALVFVAAAVAPYFVGRAAESSFKARIARINARHPGVTVHVDSYHRGFYSSEAKLSLSPDANMAPRALRLWALFLGSQGTPEFDLRINHGPIAFAAFADGHVSFVPVLYTAEFRGDKLPPMSILGIFKPDVYMRQYFDGAIASTLSVPPGRYSMGVFGATWQGALMNANVNGAGDEVHYSGSIDPIEYQARNPDNGKSYSGTIQGFAFSGDKRQSKHDFWTGRSRSIFKGARFKVDGKEAVQLGDGRGHSELREDGDGKWLGGTAAFTQRGGTIKGWKFSRFDMRESIAHVDAAGLRRFFDRLDAAGGTGDTRADKDALEAALPILGQALAPAHAVARVALRAPDGRFDITASAAFNAAAPSATSPQAFALLDRVDARATLDFDRKLVDSFSTHVLGGSAAAQSVDHVLDQWEKEGYLKAGSDGLEHSVLTYHAGEFSINGQVVVSGAGDPGSGRADR